MVSTTKEMPHVRVDKIRLYHGSATKGIKIILPAGETTVGDGAYFTSKRHAAEMYALLRSSDGRTYFEKDAKGDTKKHIIVPKGPLMPVVYEVETENLKLVDIRTHEDLKQVMVGFQKYLVKILEERKKDLPWNYEYTIKAAIGTIDILEGTNSEYTIYSKHKEAKTITPRDIIFNIPQDFSEYVKGEGYDGILALEGGEGSGFKHDSYVIFDPEKIKIVQTIKITRTEVHSEEVK